VVEVFNGRAGADTINGGTGVDWVTYNDATAGVNVNLAAGTAADGQGSTDSITNIECVRATGFNDTIVGNTSDNFVSAGVGADTVQGAAGNDTILGEDGDDTIDGGLDNDLIFGDVGNDLITGGAGNDSIVGGSGSDAGSDTISGGAGNDLIFGSANADQLFGGSDSDTIIGGGGADTIDGGAGNDIMWGDAGADRFLFSASGGNYTIGDFQSGTDKIDLTAFTFGGHAGFNAVTSISSFDNGIVITFSTATLTVIGSVASTDYLF
jgi:Ca2+-binding RTX toxin-like protein